VEGRGGGKRDKMDRDEFCFSIIVQCFDRDALWDVREILTPTSRTSPAVA